MRPLLLTMITCTLVLPAQAQYSGGSGSADDPYQIATAADLIALGETPEDYNKHFILTADIDLSIYGNQDDQNGSSVIGQWFGWGEPDNTPFSGVFDGGGHTISHLTLVSTDHPSVGLFACLGASGEIKNLRIEHCRIDAPESSYVGAVVGYSEGTITNCEIQGQVCGGEVVGGLVGYSEGFVTDCHSDTTVSGFSDVGGLVGVNNNLVTGSDSAGSVSGVRFVGGLVGSIWGSVSESNSSCAVSGNTYVGGLAGDNDGDDVIACYSTGAVSGVSSVGGLLGNNIDTVMNCYSTGAVSGAEMVGGLIGDNWPNGEISYCYSAGAVSGDRNSGGLVGFNWGDWGGLRHCFWDVEMSGQTNSAGGLGKSTAEMEQIETFVNAGWDFGTVWMMPPGDYPRLQWEEPKSVFEVTVHGTIHYSGKHTGPIHIVAVDWNDILAYEDQTDADDLPFAAHTTIPGPGPYSLTIPNALAGHSYLVVAQMDLDGSGLTMDSFIDSFIPPSQRYEPSGGSKGCAWGGCYASNAVPVELFGSLDIDIYLRDYEPLCVLLDTFEADFLYPSAGGMDYHDGCLWICQPHIGGRTAVHQVDPGTGELIATHALGDGHAMGIAWIGDDMWLCCEARTVPPKPRSWVVRQYTYDGRAFAPGLSYPLPSSTDWGAVWRVNIAWDGTLLWVQEKGPSLCVRMSETVPCRQLE